MAKSLAEELVDMSSALHSALDGLLGDIEKMDAVDIEKMRWSWDVWARPEQRIPEGEWTTWLILAGRGFGKALALDTPIPTPTGWTTIGALRIGDVIFDENGSPTTVTFATDVQHNRRCFRVVFDDGSEIVADAEHRWLTADKAARRRRPGTKARPQVRTTEQIAATLMVGKERNHAINITNALDMPTASLPVPPYTLGVWLGDGNTADATITQGKDDADELRALLAMDGTVCGEKKIDTRTGSVRWIIGSRKPMRGSDGRMIPNGSIHSELRAMGLIGCKRIPMTYLRSSVDQRMALLHGLMDTDGTASHSGHVELTLTDRDLSLDAFELVCSLGFKATINESDSKLNGRVVGRRWRIRWTPRVSVFRLTRKSGRCLASTRAQAGRTSQRFIAAVVPIPSVPVRCITVDSPSHLFLAGKTMIPTHNTKTGAEAVRKIANSGLVEHMALIASTPADARDVMIEGPAGILACTPYAERPTWNPSTRRLTWPNGCRATVFSGEAPDQLRGPQHQFVWLDELMAYQYPQQVWENVSLGNRLPWKDGSPARALITTTPRPTKLLKEIMSLPGVVVTRGSTFANRGNLDPTFLSQMRQRYEGTRIGRQELYAEVLEDIEGALWTPSMIDGCKVKDYPALDAVVVAIDPAVTSGANSDETGIVVVGRGVDGRGYVLEDLSGTFTPAGWAQRAVDALARWEADAIVAEVNNGGEMVEHTIHSVSTAAPVRMVRASRGKIRRAEPIASLYEQGRVHHVGNLAKLEDQFTTYTGTPGDSSPDRMDAAVWGLASVMLSDDQRRELGFS